MKRFAIFFVIVLIIGLLGCKGGSGSQQGTANGGSTVLERALARPGDWKYKYPEPVTLSVGRTSPADNFFEGESFENNAYMNWLREAYNIDVKLAFSAPGGADYVQRVTLAITSGDLPDIMMVTNAQQLVEIMESGMSEDLTGLFDKWASPLHKAAMKTFGSLEEAMPTTFLDGRQLAYGTTAYYGSDAAIYIRDDWRKKLGLPEPRYTDDFIRFAEACVQNDMAGNRLTAGIELQVPFVGRYAGTYTADPFFNERGSYPRLWIDDGKGRVTYGSVQPETKEALAFMRDLYDRGIIPKDYVTRDRQAATAAGQNSIIIASWSAATSAMNSTFNNNPGADFHVYNWRSSITGKRHSYSHNINTSWIVMRKGYEYPELSTRILNIICEVRSYYDGILLTPEEEQLYEVCIPVEVRDAYYGRQGISWSSWVVDTTVNFSDFIPRLARNELRNIELLRSGDPAFYNLTPGAQTLIEDIVKYQDGIDLSFAPWGANNRHLAKVHILEDYNNPDNMVIKKAYYPYNTPTMSLRWANLEDMEEQAFNSIIMGIQPLDYFDTFVREWHAQGGATIIEEVNKQLGK